jgi:hypothetical protein
MRQLTFILTAFILFGCGTNDKSNSSTIPKGKTEILTSKTTQLIDEITTPCAIIISPTDMKIDSLKRANGDDFYAVADDNLFYIGSARQLLDSLKTNTIDLEAKGQVTFIQKNGASSTIDLSEFYWGIILFNGKDEPIESDITTFESEYNSYMTK